MFTEKECWELGKDKRKEKARLCKRDGVNKPSDVISFTSIHSNSTKFSTSLRNLAEYVLQYLFLVDSFDCNFSVERTRYAAIFVFSGLDSLIIRSKLIRSVVIFLFNGLGLFHVRVQRSQSFVIFLFSRFTVLRC